MSFQWIIDYAETISINSKKVVASTTARDGTTRAVSRGGQVWRFEVKLPDGITWSELRPYITASETLDRVTSANIQINNGGQNWFIKYQGNSVNKTGFVASITQGANSLTLTTSPTTSSGYKFRAGDYIQLGSTGKVYRVTADVAYNSNTVNLHRPIIESTATGVSLRVAENCVWNVICINYPEWTLMARDQVSWSGPFVFAENLV
jgi:hypothetical protein